MKTIRNYFSKVFIIALLTVTIASCGNDDDNKLPEQFTVTFDSQGGSNVSTQTVNDGAKIKEPTAPTKDQSIFVGWYKESNYTNIWKFESDIVVKDITLYAKWQQIDYIVTFNVNGGNAIDPQGVAAGGCAIKPLTPIKEGAAFEGWYTDAALTNIYDFSTPITKDITLYAKWTEITLTSLNELIEEATQLNDNNYEDESYEIMYSKLQAAKSVAILQNPTSIEIYNAYQALINAINQLVAKPYRATSKLGLDPMPVDGLIYVTTNSENPFYLYAIGLDASGEEATNSDVNFTYDNLETWVQGEISKDEHNITFMINPALTAGSTINITISSAEFPSISQVVTLKVISIDELRTKFIEKANTLPNPNQISSDNYDEVIKTIEEAYRLYNNLPYEVMQESNVINAFNKLQACSTAIGNVAKFTYSFTGNRCEFKAYDETFYCDYESKGEFPVGAYIMSDWEKDGNKYYNNKIELKADKTFQLYYRTSASADGKNPSTWDEEEERGTYSYTGNKASGGTIYMTYEYNEDYDYHSVKSIRKDNKFKIIQHFSNK